MKIKTTAVAVRDNLIPAKTAKGSGLMDVKKKDLALNQLLAIAASKGSNINDAEAMFNLLPDMRFTSTIRVAEILSPQDLSPPKINIQFNTIDNEIDLSDSDIHKVFNDYFSRGGHYNLEGKLFKFVEESLVTAGAVPILTLKTGEIDEIVDAVKNKKKDEYHLAIESAKTKVQKPRTVLVNKSEKLEALGFSISDDARYVTSSLYDGLKNELALKDLGFENAKPLSMTILDNARSAMDAKEPIPIKLPVESVIPVIVKGQPEKHVGHYIVLEDGFPISYKKDSGEMEKLKDRLKDIIDGKQSDYENLYTFSEYTQQKNQKEIKSIDYLNVFASKMKDELTASLNKGYLRSDVEVSNHDDAYQLMFHLALKKANVRIIYVPAGVINYIAFDYDERGIGRSLCEKTQLIASLRGMLLMADIYGGVRNSVPQTVVNVEVDEDDNDAYHTLEIVRDRVTRVVGGTMPVSSLYPSDLIDSMFKSSVHMNVAGNSAFPNTSVNIEDAGRSVGKSDTELTEQLKKMHITGFGQTPEKVDRALEGDFAVSTVTSNLLEARRVMLDQQIVEEQFSELIRNITRLSPKLTAALNNAIDKDGLTFEDKLAMIEFRLPDAGVSGITAKLEAFENASALIDGIIESQCSDEMLRDLLQGEYIVDSFESVRLAISAHAKAEWCRDNDIMPGLFRFTSDDNKDILESIQERLGNVIALGSEIVKHTYETEIKGDKDINEMMEKYDVEPEPDAAPEPSGEPDIFDEPTPEDPLGEDLEEEEEDIIPEEENPTPDGEDDLDLGA